MNGTVKFYNRKKGFGFISGEDGNDYFVHFTALPRGLSIRDNDKVSFDPAEGDRGLKAENVQLLQKASEQEDGQEAASAEEEAAPEEDEASEDDDSSQDNESEEDETGTDSE